MLKVEGLYSGYQGREVLHNIDLSIKQGENLYIVGPNGSGKTTLLRCMAHLLPYRGTITLDGREIQRMNRRELALKIGLMTQMTTSYFPYTVYETVALGRYAHLHGIFAQLSARDCEKIEACLARVGLWKLRKRSIGELSGGQLQRVYLARLFVQDPDIILLDEPTNHLDLKYQIELLEFITEWSRLDGKTVVGVLHDLNIMRMYAHRAVLLDEGRIFAYGEPAEALSEENLRACYHVDISAWMRNALSKWQK